MNLQLVRASQFFQQFRLNIWYKPGKKYIISDVLNHLASTNLGYADPFYFELDTLFTYNTTLVKIYPGLVSRILADYEDKKYSACLYCQVQANEDIGNDKALLSFVIGCSYK